MNNRLPKNSKDPNHKRPFIKNALLAVAVPLLAKGFPLPGKKLLLSALTKDELAQLNRSKLAYEIKTAEYKLRFGPIWLRIVVQKLREYWLLHRFWLFVSLKVFFSLVIFLLPAFIFWIYRLFLPFPELLDRKGTIIPKELAVHYGGWVTERPFSSERSPLRSILNNSRLQLLELSNDQVVRIMPLSDSHKPAGNQPKDEKLTEFEQQKDDIPLHSNNVLLSVRNQSREETELRAARLLDPSHPLKLSKTKHNTADILGGNTLKGEFLVFSLSNLPLKCRFDLFDNDGKVLFSTEKSPIQALKSDKIFSQFSAVTDWYSNLMPKSPRQSMVSQWEEYSFAMDHLPTDLTFSIREVDPDGKTLAAGQISRVEKGGPIQAISAAKNHAAHESFPPFNDTQSQTQNCVAAVTNPVFHKLELGQSKNQKKKHGIALIVLDGVSALSARNEALMPNFTALQRVSQNFNSNFANHSDPNVALRVLLEGSSALLRPSFNPAQKNVAINTTEKLIWQNPSVSTQNLFSEAASLGYKTAFFGDSEQIFLRNENTSSNIPDVVSSSTNPHHIAVGAAQAAKDWLTENAQFPYFVVIRLSDIKDRLIPPWKFLEIGRFLLKPFGYFGRTTRYEAMLRYMDSALKFVMESLSSASQNLPVTVAITGSSSLQHQLIESNQEDALLPDHQAIHGASFKMGTALLPDNLHVPLSIVHLNQDQKSQEKTGAPQIPVLNENSKRENDLLISNNSLNSHLATHKLLQELLSNDSQAQQEQREKQPALKHGAVLHLAKGNESVGILSESSSPETVEFWAAGNHVFPEQVFEKSFPYGVTKIHQKRPQELLGGYDTVSGSFKKLRPISKETLFSAIRSKETETSHELKVSSRSALERPALILKVPEARDLSLTLRSKIVEERPELGKNSGNPQATNQDLLISYKRVSVHSSEDQDLSELHFKLQSDAKTVSLIYRATDQSPATLQSGLTDPYFQLIIRGLEPQTTLIDLESEAPLTLCANPVEKAKLGKQVLTALYDELPMCAFELFHNSPATTKLESPIEIEYGWP